MKILETRTAPNPRRVRIFLAEKGIPMTYEDYEIGNLKTPEFTALNSFQRVPVLVLDDGTAISETMAICRYFEAIQPEPALFGQGAKAQAIVEMWNRRVELNLLACVAQAFRHLHPAMAKLEVPQVAAWGEANKPKALEALEKIDAALAASRYIAGDTYSVADITLLVAIDFMRPARIQRPENLKNLARWYDDVQARPSAKA
ncbi:MAG: glutathione S-transferase [Hyphomicrobiales bacterium]|nr:MAG: glutathione S-transferase [Hyphomicrobiales bacterium]